MCKCWKSPIVCDDIFQAPSIKIELPNLSMTSTGSMLLRTSSIHLKSSRTLEVITPRELLAYRVSILERTPSGFVSRDSSVRNRQAWNS